MPHKNKKKFIDKKKAVTFQLVHRSQKDPLAADEEAPQRVLVPVLEWGEHHAVGETPDEREARISQQRLYGVGFDDEYDYMQHLKEPDRPTAILVPKSGRVALDDLPEENHSDEHKELTEIFKDGVDPISFKIPSVVFASKQEEETGMLHRAIPPVGPQVEWDPDVVAAMDEDFDFNDPDNVIEDDFVLQATEEHPGCDQMEEDCEDSDTIGSSGSSGYMESDDDMFAEEETRSRFTQYSMTSSVLRRNEHLTLLDDQFEKFYETYDDENIGDLAQVEIDGAFPVDNLTQEDALKRLLGVEDCPSVHSRSDRSDQVESKRLVRIEELVESGSSDGEDKMVEITKEVPSEKWDCESIISTYSNLYNHPKVIADPPKAIKLSKKTGIPLDSLPTRGLTKKQLKVLDLENEDTDCSKRFHTVSESSNVTSAASNVRRKGETREEKAARKQAVKEQRKERRAEKKATKIAFKEEKTRQSKELINLQQNLNGIRIS